jgi:hypothetical protein
MDKRLEIFTGNRFEIIMYNNIGGFFGRSQCSTNFLTGDDLHGQYYDV